MNGARTELLVTSPGALASVQDRGRPGWRRLGVPGAGALNPAWLRIANAMAGQDENATAIEYLVAGPTLQATDAPVHLGFAGDAPLTLTHDGTNRVHDGWCSLVLRPGDTLRVGSPRHGRVGYVAVQGLAVPKVLGSAATYARAALGGLDGRALRAGDRLDVLAADEHRTDRHLARLARGLRQRESTTHVVDVGRWRHQRDSRKASA